MDECLRNVQPLKPDCFDLQYSRIDHTRTMNPEFLISIDLPMSMECISIGQMSLITFSMYTVGLIGSFAEFCVIDFLQTIRISMRRFLRKIIRMMNNVKIKNITKSNCWKISWKSVKLIISLSCLSANFIHLFITLLQYFQYKHATSIFQSPYPDTRPPKIMICYKNGILNTESSFNISSQITFRDILAQSSLEYARNITEINFFGFNCLVLQPKYETTNMMRKNYSRMFTHQFSNMDFYNQRNTNGVSVVRIRIYVFNDEDMIPTNFYPFYGCLIDTLGIKSNDLFSSEFKYLSPLIIKTSLLRKPFASRCRDDFDIRNHSKCYTDQNIPVANCSIIKCDHAEWGVLKQSKNNMILVDVTKAFTKQYIDYPERQLSIILKPSSTLLTVSIGCLSIISFWLGLSLINIAIFALEMIKMSAGYSVKIVLYLIFSLLLISNLYFVLEEYFMYSTLSKMHNGYPLIFEPPFFSYSYSTSTRIAIHASNRDTQLLCNRNRMCRECWKTVYQQMSLEIEDIPDCEFSDDMHNDFLYELKIHSANSTHLDTYV